MTRLVVVLTSPSANFRELCCRYLARLALFMSIASPNQTHKSIVRCTSNPCCDLLHILASADIIIASLRSSRFDFTYVRERYNLFWSCLYVLCKTKQDNLLVNSFDVSLHSLVIKKIQINLSSQTIRKKIRSRLPRNLTCFYHA